MANIIGTNSNDTLMGSDEADTINGKAGNDTITNSYSDYSDKDTLTGGGGKDKFVFNDYISGAIITDFGGVGKGVNPSAEVIAEVDTLEFQGYDFTAQNLLLTQNGSNLEITFERLLFDELEEPRFFLQISQPVILQNFALENLANLSKSTGATVNLGNIQFSGETSITDSFDVVNANSTQHNLFRKNTVTFFNDLNNYVLGFDNSDDVINGQGGNDKIDGLSGNDLLRGGVGNNTLIGGVGNDTLNANYSIGDNLLNGGDGDDSLGSSFADGNNTLNGDAGNDVLNISSSKGDNLLNGGDGNDNFGSNLSSGNNTLNGGAGNDRFILFSTTGDNLVNGGDGNDSLRGLGYSYIISGTNTLIGGVGNDTLEADYSTGNNLLNGDDGNDYLLAGGVPGAPGYRSASGNNTLNGGAGDDDLNTYYSTGDKLLDGGDGNDRIYVNAGNDVIYGTYGGNDTIDGGKGEDTLSVNYSATEGITTIFNATTNIGSITAGTNRVIYKNIERLDISGTGYDDLIVGSNGNDTLSTGYGGNDTIDGGKGDDYLLFGVDDFGLTKGITSIFNATTNIGSITAGTNLANLVSYKNIERLDIRGTGYDDLIVGSNGNDTLSTGYGGNDTIDGGKGEDTLSVNYSQATGGITTIFNATTNIGSITAGTNQVSYKNIERLDISGTRYDDFIVGNDGNDTLSGNDGNDTLSGSNGNDTLYGGFGTDTFIFYNYNKGVDIIYDFNYDFNATNELIQVSAAGFDRELSLGSLGTSQFTIGTSATTNTQRFIYNDITGGLFFDQDGGASGFTQVQFAQLSTGLSLTENNFVVVAQF